MTPSLYQRLSPLAHLKNALKPQSTLPHPNGAENDVPGTFGGDVIQSQWLRTDIDGTRPLSAAAQASIERGAYLKSRSHPDIMSPCACADLRAPRSDYDRSNRVGRTSTGNRAVWNIQHPFRASAVSGRAVSGVDDVLRGGFVGRY